MITNHYLNALRKITTRLKDTGVNWVITGSLGMALQGMDIEVHDIDIQTDRRGAYEIEGEFTEYVIEPVRYSQVERICSHFGKLEIGGVKIEIMGDVQKRITGQMWEEPVRVECYRRWIQIEGMQLPVLALEYEYQAYLKLCRKEKAEVIRRWLQNSGTNST